MTLSNAYSVFSVLITTPIENEAPHPRMRGFLASGSKYVRRQRSRLPFLERSEALGARRGREATGWAEERAECSEESPTIEQSDLIGRPARDLIAAAAGLIRSAGYHDQLRAFQRDTAVFRFLAGSG